MRAAMAMPRADKRWCSRGTIDGGMKILFVNTIGGYFGGVEQIIADMAVGFAERGHECSLAFGTEGRDLEKFAQQFVHARWCRELGPPSPPPEALPFEAIVEHTKPDVLFFHNVPHLLDAGASENGVRRVRMVHDVGLMCPSGLGYFRHGRHSCAHPAGWRCWLDLAFLGRGTSQKCPIRFVSISEKIREMRRYQDLDAILTVSGYMKNRLVINGFDSGRVHVTEPVLRQSTVVVSPLPETPEILYVGALQRGKGVDLLLRALSKVSMPFHLSVVGTGKLQVRLERLSDSLGLGDQVQFHGWVPHEELSGFHQKARIIVVPTRAPESFCFAGPEAMRHSRPVVAFDVGGISSWLEHEKTGLLIPEQDTAAFARAVEYLLSDQPYARRLGEKAANRFREKYSFPAFLEHVETVLAASKP